MEQVNLKELLAQANASLKQETDYAKLTVAEKLSVLLSWAIGVLVAIIVGGIALYFLASSLHYWLVIALGSVWGATAILLAVLALIAALVYGYRKALIVNPVARFVTKLLLSKQ